MANKLKNMCLTSVDLVRNGANQEADICLYKSADPQEAAEGPTEDEKSIFKRFLAFIRGTPAEAENEPHSPIEKAEEPVDIESIYKSALAESIHSIYTDDSLTEIEKKAMQTGTKKPATASDPDPSDEELEGDEMLPQAVEVILETGQASVSMLQRRLKLGYARAARIVDEMEEKGIVGPFQGSKPRAILITKDQWESMKSGGNSQMAFDDLEQVEDFEE